MCCHSVLRIREGIVMQMPRPMVLEFRENTKALTAPPPNWHRCGSRIFGGTAATAPPLFSALSALKGVPIISMLGINPAWGQGSGAE